MWGLTGNCETPALQNRTATQRQKQRQRQKQKLPGLVRQNMAYGSRLNVSQLYEGKSKAAGSMLVASLRRYIGKGEVSARAADRQYMPR
jgi:hypothetical protein